MSDGRAKKLLDDLMTIEELGLKLRKTFLPKFRAILPDIKVVRYYQVQSDIFVDMLTYGFFGANVREALMLGKPAVCYLRPEWLETMRREGYELSVGKPHVILRRQHGVTEEPFETLDIEVPTDKLGPVMEIDGKTHGKMAPAKTADVLKNYE